MKYFFNFLMFCFFFASLAHSQEKLNRSSLPINEPSIPKIKEMEVKNAKAPPFFQVNAPKKAPNVLVILIDDIGFGQAGTFGGPINMPTLEKLSKGGIRYNNFHTTALCSPTRMALQTGRNHHTANTGSIMETATNFPGNTSKRPESVAPLAQILKLNGYNTAAFGKYHETPAWELGAVGPFTQWPTDSGFERFYGFIGGETNQWSPTVYDNTTRVDLKKDIGYHFTVDMTNKAIEWVRTQKTLAPDKPFFVYFATGATHAPHHVPKEWIQKYKGKFDKGWDHLRQEVFSNQKRMGIIPESAELTKMPKDIKDWEGLSADEKKLFSHQMEIFAGFGEQTDYEIGRLVDSIDKLGVLDNTLIFYIVGDNGASAEGGMHGSSNEMLYFNAVPETVQDLLKIYDDLGGPKTYGHYAAGWAIAGVTPFSFPKQIASDFGGTTNPLVIHWPKGIKAKDQLRSQFTYITDVAATVLDAAKIPMPKYVNGIKQTPLEGTSMTYTFENPNAKETHTTQYFEIFGNRGIYHDGWFARTIHFLPWDFKTPPFNSDKWELYNTKEDFSLAKDLASSDPQKLEEMKEIFTKEAIKYKVFPLDDRRVQRFNAELAGRPDLNKGRTKVTYYEGMVGMAEDVFLNLKNKSYSITAEIDSKGSDSGVIICQGGFIGGWSFYLKKGKPTFTYNWVGKEKYTIESSKSLPKGKSKLRFEFLYEGKGVGREALGKGGIGKIYIDDKEVAQGKIGNTNMNVFSVSDTADVGIDLNTPVADDYIESKFSGKIESVTVEMKTEKKESAAVEGKSEKI
ncbi:MAG: arylsulfatase [Bacteriovoracales bacterium]